MAEIERESMEYDVVIVGAGPAGLSAAIRLKQLDANLEVVVLEKGSEVGAHILSGAVLDPAGLNALIPDWKEKGAPIKVEVKEDNFLKLSEGGSSKLPNAMMPPLMNNHGNYIVSMANVCRWMAEQAEGMGVEIFPGMACSELVYGDNGELKGVVAGEFGKAKDGSEGAGYEPGMELHGKYVFLSEGARGSLSKQVIAKYDLAKDADHQKYGLGMKEIWEVKPENHNEGEVTHTMGWPLGDATGGSFMYHIDNNQVYVGFIVDLNYKNPHMFPYMEFQRWKHHPAIAKVLEGGKRVSYGARVVTKGGIQSIPKACFPGGALLGCSAGGLVNLPRIKGNHNAMHSGKAAAEAAYEAIQAGRSGDELTGYDTELREGPVGQDLKPVRNVAPLNGKYGPKLGMMLGGFDMWCQTLFKFSLFGTVSHGKDDAGSTGKASDYAPIEYPKPDGKLSFDRLTNVSFSGTNHEEEQPCHLQLADVKIPVDVNLAEFAEPAQRYCPAGVYEIIRDDDGSNPKFQINAQNCVHCKTCDIKDPSRNITWATPQGGEGPNYPNM
ncbi:electron transfer flavoprotein-ubiquinone oxidoreductase [Amylibacter sp. SFDW26]|uniref:electron transfer flavoprotein-ubiquinone oxidoreductase n=1 Tax=Amylibacter sp. SFDW26 TaxID=2652722 RepID=UPI001262A06A|nr:electron transfer flavoprotein-ubiquinone oxidoreductase [Amylibacter sp. SFDW26]KAB7614770.1 electron transfer flavoprotein-ubiquinone oxidoreductase [Amylibacter sp. SFDW26]